MGKVSRRSATWHDIMWQYSGRRVQEIFPGEVPFKLKLELSIEVGQGRREEKSRRRRGRKACAKALRWEGKCDWKAIQGESGEVGRGLKAAENLAPSPRAVEPCSVYKAKWGGQPKGCQEALPQTASLSQTAVDWVLLLSPSHAFFLSPGSTTLS